MLLAFCNGVCMGTQGMRRDTLSVYFRKGVAEVDTSFYTNAKVLDSIVGIVSRSSGNSPFGMRLDGYASVEGSITFNMRLSAERTEALLSYIEKRTGVLLGGREDVLCEGMGVDWEGFETLLEDGEQFPYSERALSIVRNTPQWILRDGRVVGGRKKSLMDLNGGRTFNYMMDNLFPQLRRVDVVVSYAPLPQVTALPFEAGGIFRMEGDTLAAPLMRPVGVHIPLYRMALKTNLLADVALMPSPGPWRLTGLPHGGAGMPCTGTTRWLSSIPRPGGGSRPGSRGTGIIWDCLPAARGTTSRTEGGDIRARRDSSA